jgi:transposase
MLPRMKALSTDLRERVLAAHARGLSRKELIDLFGVSQGSITRWVRQYKTSGRRSPGLAPGRARLIPIEQDELLRRQVSAYPDATLAEQVARWHEEQGVRVSTWTMSRALKRIGWSRKKSR